MSATVGPTPSKAAAVIWVPAITAGANASNRNQPVRTCASWRVSDLESIGS